MRYKLLVMAPPLPGPVMTVKDMVKNVVLVMTGIVELARAGEAPVTTTTSAAVARVINGSLVPEVANPRSLLTGQQQIYSAEE